MAQPLGTKIANAFVEIGASLSSSFGDQVQEGVTTTIQSRSAAIGLALSKLGDAVFAKFSLPLIAATTANIAQFQALDREIRTVLTLFGTAPSLVDDTFSEMAEGIRGVSEEVGGLEREIAEGLYQTISAGIPEEGAFEFLEVAQMAAIADRTADLTTAVDGLTTVVNVFGLEAEDAGEAADVMFQTVALGKTTFGELSSDIGRVAPLAESAGVSFQELFATVGSLTLGGLQTSEAISFLRAAITGLLRPTDELNQVFREAGFASAEAAVPAIGLQKAFQLVFEAVDGSTSKMQELIGTSEGVSAILGVTGDNAGRFDNVMSGVENSTGAAARAFDIMDNAVGRAFGRMTEAFDRLGNTFGDLGQGLIVPFVRVLTDVINNLVGVFERLRPVAEGAALVIGDLVKVFNLPVIKEFVTVIGSVGIALSGLIGIVGIAAKAIGGLLLGIFNLTTVQLIVGRLGGAFNFLRGSTIGAGVAMSRWAAANTAATGPMKLATRGAANLGFAMQGTRFASLAGAAALGGVGVAVTGLITAFFLARKEIQDTAEENTIITNQFDRLADSLELVNQGFSFETIETATSRLADFREENSNLLRVLEDVRSRLGETAAEELVASLAVQLVWVGNAPEDVLNQIGLLEAASGIEIDIELGDLEDASSQLEITAAGIETLIDRVGGQASTFTPAINDAANAVVNLIQASIRTGEFEQLEEVLSNIKEQAEAGSGTANALAGAIENVLSEAVGVDILNVWEELGLGDAPTAVELLDIDTLLGELQKLGLATAPINVRLQPDLDADPQEIQDQFELDLFDGDIEALSAAREAVKEFGFSLTEVKEIGAEGIQAYEGLLEGIDGTFSAAKEQVLGAFSEIRGQIESQMPLLDIYSGAVEQSFSEWQAGQQQFRDDLASITELRERLVGDKSIPEEFVEQFDRAPISEQAWLAGLGQEELETALAELSATFEAVDTAGTERIVQSIPDIMEDARTQIQEQYNLLTVQAGEQGPIVANAFRDKFDEAAGNWETSMQNQVTALELALGEIELPAPTVKPIEFDSDVMNEELWIEALSPADLQSAAESIFSDFHLVDQATRDQILEDLTTLLNDSNTEVDEKLTNMVTTAGDKGTAVGRDFNTNLDTEAANWVTTVDAWLQAVITKINTTTIPGPRVGAPVLPSSGSSSQGNTNVTVEFHNPTSHNAEEDAMKSVAVLSTIDIAVV